MIRKTIMLKEDLHAKIQRLRGERMARTGKSCSFNRIAVELMEKGLEKLKNDI